MEHSRRLSSLLSMTPPEPTCQRFPTIAGWNVQRAARRREPIMESRLHLQLLSILVGYRDDFV